MLVENHPPLESSSPRRWNLAVMPIAVLLIAATATLGERRSTIGAEPQTEEPQAKESAGEEPQAEPVAAPAPKATPARAAKKPQLIAPAKASTPETPKPSPSPVAGPQIVGPAPGAGTVAPRKPRTIAPGDILNIEINTNYPDYLLLPPQTTVTVDDDGTVLLGSNFPSAELAGKSLAQAARVVQSLVSNPMWNTFIAPDDKPLAMNVRISYANAVARPPGTGATYAPSLSGTVTTVPGPNVYGTTRGYTPPVSVDAVEHDDPFAAKVPPEEGVRIPSKPVATTRIKLTGQEGLIQPLDTVQVLLSLNSDRVVGGSYMGGDGDPRLRVSGTYPIEPDGNISLPHSYGRVNLKGLDQKQAGTAVRKHLSGIMPIQTALPTVRVVKRGRAVWPEGKEPGPDYRVRAGDKLLIGMDLAPKPFEFTVNPEGKLGFSLGAEKSETPVVGLTLAEVQEALQKIAVREVPAGISGTGGEIATTTKKYSVPIFVTIGGWREEAEPEVVEQFEVSDAGRVQRLENDIRELKDMVRKLKGARN